MALLLPGRLHPQHQRRALMKDRLLVVGGGLVGLATAWQYLRTFPSGSVTVLEKEPDVARHQSGHNSGVLHTGLSYRPDSLKARLAVTGLRRMLAFCRRHDIPHEVCGKLVVATRKSELPRLQELQSRGLRNGLRGLEILSPERIAEFEPHAGGIAALLVPEEGVVEFPAVAQVLKRQIVALGGEVVTSAPVLRLQGGAGWVAETTAGSYRGTFLVNCAGLQADRVARLAGERPRIRIVPFRGEFYRLSGPSARLVRHLIYPVGLPGFPFLGVHLTRRADGTVLAGPNAVLALAREGYRPGSLVLKDLLEMARFPGLYRFVLAHPRMVWHELVQSASRDLFARAVRRLVPEVRHEDLAPGGTGVRAQAMTPRGTLVQDFVLLRRSDALHVLNAPSPAATASLSIAREIVRHIALLASAS